MGWDIKIIKRKGDFLSEARRGLEQTGIIFVALVWGMEVEKF